MTPSRMVTGTARMRTSLSLHQPNADPWNQTYGYDGARRLTGTGFSRRELRLHLRSRVAQMQVQQAGLAEWRKYRPTITTPWRGC